MLAVVGRRAGDVAVEEDAELHDSSCEGARMVGGGVAGRREAGRTRIASGKSREFQPGGRPDAGGSERMEYVTLGRSGLHVSRQCLGAMMFGRTQHAHLRGRQPADHRRLPRHWRQLHRHGQRVQRRPVGGGHRPRHPAPSAKQVVLATKGWGAIGEGPQRVRAWGASTSPTRWTTACAGCGTDFVDLYQCQPYAGIQTRPSKRR